MVKTTISDRITTIFLTMTMISKSIKTTISGKIIMIFLTMISKSIKTTISGKITTIFLTMISKSIKITISGKITMILGSDRIFIVAMIFLAMISQQ